MKHLIILITLGVSLTAWGQVKNEIGESFKEIAAKYDPQTFAIDTGTSGTGDKIVIFRDRFMFPDVEFVYIIDQSSTKCIAFALFFRSISEPTSSWPSFKREIYKTFESKDRLFVEYEESVWLEMFDGKGYFWEIVKVPEDDLIKLIVKRSEN